MRILRVMRTKPGKADKTGISLGLILGVHMSIYYLYVTVINITVGQQCLMWLNVIILKCIMIHVGWDRAPSCVTNVHSCRPMDLHYTLYTICFADHNKKNKTLLWRMKRTKFLLQEEKTAKLKPEMPFCKIYIINRELRTTFRAIFS